MDIVIASLFPLPLGEGKEDAEFGSFADRALDFQRAVVRFNDQFAVKEADTEAFFLGGLERPEKRFLDEFV